MKYILTFIFLIGIAQAQNRALNASGRTKSLAPAVSVSGTTSETVLLSDTIKGKTLSTYKSVKFKIYCSITSLLTPPSVTVRVKYGANSVSIVNGLSINVSQTNKPFVIEGVLVNRGVTNSQYIYGTVQQHATLGPLALTSPIYQASGTISTDSETDQLFSITSQFGASIGTTTLQIDYWEIIID